MVSPANASPEYQLEASTAPLYGQVIVTSSSATYPAGKRTFNFNANGTDERAKLIDLYQYFADELAADRKVSALMGAGDYGISANGIIQTFANGSRGLRLQGSGRGVTRIGFIDDAIVPTASWRVMEWYADNLPIIETGVSITQTGGVATLTATAHGASVGSTIWVYNANEEQYNGLKYVESVTANTLTYVVPTDAPASATGTIHVAIHDNFLHDFTVSDMTLYDANPVGHAGVSEETHGIGFSHMKDLTIQNVGADKIGDEPFELVDCYNFAARNIYSNGAPATEQTGGSVFSIKGGSHLGVLDGFYFGSQPDTAANTYGIGFKTTGQVRKCSGHIITNGFIVNPTESGINFDTSGTEIEGIRISHVSSRGGAYGINQGGGGNLLSDIYINDFNAADFTYQGIELNRVQTDLADVTIVESKIDGRLMPRADNTSACIVAGGTGLIIRDCDLRNARMGVFCTSQCDGAEVVGGKITNCGDATFTRAQYVYSDGTNVQVKGVTIDDGKSSDFGFRGIDVIQEVKFLNMGTIPTYIAYDVNVFDRNVGVPAAIRLDATDGKSVRDNTFVQSSTSAGVGCILINGCTDAVITGNQNPNLAIGEAIVEAAGSNRNIIANNNMLGGTRTIVGASTLDVNNLPA